MHIDLLINSDQNARLAIMDSAFAIAALTITLDDIIIRRRHTYSTGCDGV